jgi:hypothetical protein
MTINAGVWIDDHKAVVVLLTDQGQEMVQIVAEDSANARLPAGLRPKNAYQPSGLMAEGSPNRSHLNEYYDAVIAYLSDAQAILILGPGETKGELRQRIASQKLRGHIAQIKTVAKLPDEKISDYVRQHFQ